MNSISSYRGITRLEVGPILNFAILRYNSPQPRSQNGDESIHMLSANKILLIGQIGRDLELRSTRQGRPVCTFALATHRTELSKEGASRERTQWHPIVAWDWLGEQCAEHLRMGDTIFVEGHLHYPQTDETTPEESPSFEVIAITVQFIKHREPPKKSAERFTSEGEPS